MSIRSGIVPLDERLGGLREGELYLLTGVAGSGRLVALLQYLNAGLSEGPVGLVTAAPLSRVFDEARYWGLDLEQAWRDGTFRLLTLEDDFERRLTAAPDPAEVYDEMTELLGSDVRRVALYPGTALWDVRAGTSFASRFLTWAEASPATVLAAVPANLEDGVSAATERVLGSATGILSMEVASDGGRRLSVKRMTPAPADATPIVLDLVPGSGLRAASERPDERWGERGLAPPKHLLLLTLAQETSRELDGWARRSFEVEAVTEPFRAVELVQETPNRFAAILIYLDRTRVADGIRACRSLRRIGKVPVLLATDDMVRGADRIRAREAGANDFLHSPLNIAELASRVEHAVVSGAVSVTEPSGSPLRVRGGGELLDPARFSSEVERRLSHPEYSIFTLLVIGGPADQTASSPLARALVNVARQDDGDRVGLLPAGFGVVLAGASVRQAGAFMDRVEEELGQEAPPITWTALSGTADAPAVLESLGEARAHSRTGT